MQELQTDEGSFSVNKSTVKRAIYIVFRCGNWKSWLALFYCNNDWIFISVYDWFMSDSGSDETISGWIGREGRRSRWVKNW